MNNLFKKFKFSFRYNDLIISKDLLDKIINNLFMKIELFKENLLELSRKSYNLDNIVNVNVKVFNMDDMRNKHIKQHSNKRLTIIEEPITQNFNNQPTKLKFSLITSLILNSMQLASLNNKLK